MAGQQEMFPAYSRIVWNEVIFDSFQAGFLKGLDYEEALILAALAVATWSQAPLYDREAQVAWFKGPDLAVAAIALFVFLGFGAFTYRITPQRLERVRDFGYRVQRGRFLRTASTLAIAVSAGALYVFLRVPVRFTKLPRRETDRTLELHAAIGRGTSPLMVANGDKAVKIDQFFVDAAAGHLPAFCLVEPDYEHTSEENSEDITLGEKFTSSVVDAVMHGADGLLAGAHPGLVAIIHTHVHPTSMQRLAEEAADLAGARHSQLVLFGQLIHAQDGDDVAQRPVLLEDLLGAAGDLIVLVADHQRVEDP